MPIEISGPPELGVTVPAVVTELAGDDAILPVWRNELGGLTFELSGADETRRFVKWMPAGVGVAIEQEAERLEWAGRVIVVPEVLATGDDDEGSWMLTAGLEGDSAVSERFHEGDEGPRFAARAIGVGLRVMHDTLPVADCPFSWSVADRIRRARGDGIEVPAVLEGEAPPIDRLVVCHGDACAPNTLALPDGTFTGHVDLGELGLADRWADLAVATWSLEWNFGPDLDSELLDAYGIDADLERIGYYRRLWDAT